MSYGSISFHNTVSVKIERQIFESGGRPVENISIAIIDDKDDRITINAMGDPTITVTMPETPASSACALDMTRKFAVNGLKDELFGGESEGLSNEEIADALVRYLESYGAKFQADDAV